jgi:hypothetical protein
MIFEAFLRFIFPLSLKSQQSWNVDIIKVMSEDYIKITKDGNVARGTFKRGQCLGEDE